MGAVIRTCYEVCDDRDDEDDTPMLRLWLRLHTEADDNVHTCALLKIGR